MTKADIVNEISRTTGIEKVAVQATVEAFMESIKNSVVEGKNVYLRGFGSFVVKKRAEKTARNISKNVTFKPSRSFVNDGRGNVKKKEGGNLCKAERKEKDIRWLPTNGKKD